ncbi:Hypothetical predicted protein [Olea europaea subsp. europaea]|uniref:Uncharacterized protein n=1 Tax=Olea europaea subsp. europaea TaxID=158383 RepID=A0A8S0U6U4_OLEEU|nr:Hypothetical predicted protein [Olea europaea subsp. europaea]
MFVPPAIHLYKGVVTLCRREQCPLSLLYREPPEHIEASATVFNEDYKVAFLQIVIFKAL